MHRFCYICFVLLVVEGPNWRPPILTIWVSSQIGAIFFFRQCGMNWCFTKSPREAISCWGCNLLWKNVQIGMIEFSTAGNVNLSPFSMFALFNSHIGSISNIEQYYPLDSTSRILILFGFLQFFGGIFREGAIKSQVLWRWIKMNPN